MWRGVGHTNRWASKEYVQGNRQVMMDEDGPNILFAFAIAVVAAIGAWSLGGGRIVAFLVGINAGGIYDFYGRAKEDFSIMGLFWPNRGAAYQQIPIWFGVLFVDGFMLGSHLRWF